MNGISTLTQKGQVAIPKSIRDYFHLQPHDKVHFEVKNNNIVARRLSSIEEMRGIIKVNKILFKKEMKKIIREAVLEKFERKMAQEKAMSKSK